MARTMTLKWKRECFEQHKLGVKGKETYVQLELYWSL